MQRRRNAELAYNLRSSSSHSAMDLPGGGSSSIQRPINIDLNVIDEARIPMQHDAPNDHFAPARDSSRHKRKTPASSSSSSSTNSDANTNTNANTINSNNSLNALQPDEFSRNTRARSNYYVIDLEEEEYIENIDTTNNNNNTNNNESDSDEPVLDPDPVASETVLGALRGEDNNNNNNEGNNNNNNNNNEGNNVNETLTLEEERGGEDSDNGSNGSDVDYSGLLRALVAVRERREGRGRVLTEIRNVLDILRNSDNVGNEDISFVHRVMSMARNNLFDRHRDMRLDVDNMSYEELLALEERIGNVNTGLSEEKVMSCLEQRKFVFPSAEKSDSVEPCCICQEEYEKGAETGRLGCAHEFHLACIKQWLSHKNSCPICKTAALDT